MRQTSMEEALQQRDQAITQVGEAADCGWKAEARAAVKRCLWMGTFTTDEVWEAISPHHQTHERRAMGAIMKSLAAEGVIRATSEWRQSRRPECHARPIRVWRAL